VSRRRGQRGHEARRWEELRRARLDDLRTSTTAAPEDVSVWINDRYQVVREVFDSNAFGERMVYLSIKRRDKNPVRDWRHLQQIKNELIGEECEAFEIYPASSRLVDDANQYHLWGFLSPATRIPVGFGERSVTDDPEAVGAVGGVGRPRQREFEEGLTL